MLKLKHITKQYHAGDITVDALKGIDLEFRKSEFVAVLGPSGCGKTTLLNIIGGLDRYTQGDLLIDSISTKEFKDSDWDIYRNNSIGFVFQTYNLIPHQTVLANVELALTLAGVSKAERRERAAEALEKVGLGDQLKKKPNQLSGGQMQRVAIARALVNNPEILLADEPTGALDSETSVQIMEILKEVAKDRMVIMVTHNPELADEYATRIIKLSDGLVVDDSNPHDTGRMKHKIKDKQKKISMSLLTALALSLSNLFTKKGRTIMTAFAGSIGIIGIALILSFANGVNNYIQNTEEEMLTIYPLSIQNQGMDITSMFLGMQTGVMNDSDASGKDSGIIKEGSMINDIFTGIGTNDLKSLKAYFESGKSEIKENTNAIQYQYNITPQLFSEDTSKKIHKINPDETFSALGFGSQSASSIMNFSTSSNTFYEMTDDISLFEDQYEVLAGHWPEEYNECLLVLTPSGRMMDLMMYQLGFRDSKVLDDMLTQFMNNEEVTVPDDEISITYDDIMAKNLKVVPNYEYFRYDKKYKIWEDMSKNKKFMRKVIKNSESINVVGIVKPTSDSSTNALQPGIYYTSALTSYLMDRAAESEIVNEQLDHPKVNVFTGKTFKEEAKEDDTDTNIDFSSLMTIDQNAIQSAFKFDTSKLNIDFSKYMDMKNMDMGDVNMDDMPAPDLSGVDLTTSINMAAAMALMNEIVEDYITNPGGMTFSEYIQQPAVQDKINKAMGGIVDNTKLEASIGKALETYMTSYMTKMMEQVTKAMTKQIEKAMTKAMADLAKAIPSAMSIDTEKFAQAFQMNMDEEELQTMMMAFLSPEESSYDNNLVKLGFATVDDPYTINIFPKDFQSKQNVIDILDSYNERMEKEGYDDKVIIYTDLVGTLMTSLNRIVDLISYVLIAFVAISLVVSSIMIGIITLVSVLERVKEIGILRSIGASKRDISRVFNAETLIIGFAAGLLGILMTLIINQIGSAIVLSKFDVPDIATLPTIAGPILVILSMFLTYIAGLIPSGIAARKDPVEALRSE